MIFDNIYWILCILGVPIYWLLPIKLRHGFLFILSFFYLSTLALGSVIALLFWATAFYFLSPISKASQKSSFAIFLIFGVLGFLIFFKYLSFVIQPVSTVKKFGLSVENIVIPLGISYYTFKLIHYAIEVRRGTIGDHTFQQFLCYIFLFPIFTAGPIERFDHFIGNCLEKWSVDTTVQGTTRIAHGMIKKFLIVDIVLYPNLLFGKDKAVNILSNLSGAHSLEIWALLFITYMGLYLGFSAYNDIAIGTALLFGFKIMENFNWPIFASSIVDFWRRWHMTLAGWVQSYVYMPLVGLYRQPIVALFTSFFIIGIWHEFTISRIAWGFYHAAAITVYTLWSRSRRRTKRHLQVPRLNRLGGILVTQIFLITSMVFFVGEPNKNLYDCARILAKLIWLDLPPNVIQID